MESGFIKYFKNTGYLFLEKAIRTIVNLLVWALVIRYLGPEQFGIFSYALSFVLLFSILSDLGLNAIVVRDLLRNETQENQILGSAFALRFWGAVLAIGLIFGILQFLTISFSTKVIIMIMSLRMIFQAFYIIDYYFQSRVLSKFTVYSQLMGLLASSVLCLTFVYFKKTLIFFVSVVIIEEIVISLGLIFFYKKNQQKVFAWQYTAGILQSQLKDAWPLIVSGVAIAIYMRIDQIMIHDMLGAKWVGYYSAAVRISEAFYFVPIILTNSLFPAIVNAKLKSSELYQNRLQSLFSLLLWMAIGISILMTLISTPLVRILLGPEYSLSAQVVAIHIWASIFVFWGVARTKWAINENFQIYTMFFTIIGAGVNVILNFYLIKALDIRGAAIATVISQFVAAVFSSLLSRKTQPIFFLQIKAINPYSILVHNRY